MAINPMALMKLKGRLELFQQDHPKVGPFFQMLRSRALAEGTIYELKVTTTDGQEYVSNIRLTANDIETLQMLSRER